MEVKRHISDKYDFPGNRVTGKTGSRVRISLSPLLKDWFSTNYNPIKHSCQALKKRRQCTIWHIFDQKCTFWPSQ